MVLKYFYNLLFKRSSFQDFIFKVLSFVLLDDEERDDPMIKVFPKVTKCTFHNFGVSGSIIQVTAPLMFLKTTAKLYLTYYVA